MITKLQSNPRLRFQNIFHFIFVLFYVFFNYVIPPARFSSNRTTMELLAVVFQ